MARQIKDALSKEAKDDAYGKRSKMTKDKAINTLSAMLEDYEGDEFPNEEAAIKLGIEALIAVKYVRRNYPNVLVAPIPGETNT